ncbi:hypothetical protein DVH24_041813 [Malus domestica]|uniref:Uncharacterized protein n=1 Tax=Malus domestica TaxID=3750 RepID=A0A498ISB4_MALDO|nr:hypothetical protein DVH24_041813 [Malus domestica]
MGGLGKTTLAKSVYNEGSVHKFFEKKIWICVSDTFDVNSILHQMSEQLNRKKAPSKDNQNTLLLSLDEELKDKKYLLVLDDVWNEDSKIWESFMECLSKLSSAKGSKIIVTTRKDKVALTSERLLPRHELGKLYGDQCWSIMKNRACSGNSDPEFDKIGREIAEKCRGVPLVAKVLGGILHTKKSIGEWSSFKNSRIWDNLSKGEDIIMPVLRLSFDNLESASLKQCFAYCSMFKKDFEIERDNLIQLWMTQGLLRPSHGESKEMEDIGNEYFDILLQSSLFQDATISNNGIVSKCKMHDLVHDLAERELDITGCPKLSWFGVKSSRVEKEEKCISLQSTSDLRSMTSLRLLYIVNCERLESWVSSLQFPPSLDTLAIRDIPNLQILPSLDSLNSLRDLEIGGFWEELDSFPDFEVGSLMHLRELSLCGWPKLKSLPQQIQHLTSLSYLIIVNFEGVETLPEWLGSLTSLTYLSIQGCKNLMNLPSVQAMQRLTKLQSLRIINCHPLLEERCRRDSGTDWPKISHIPYFYKLTLYVSLFLFYSVSPVVLHSNYSPDNSWIEAMQRLVILQQMCIGKTKYHGVQGHTSPRLLVFQFYVQTTPNGSNFRIEINLQFPLSFEALTIRDIPNLESLPSLDSLHSLHHLEIGRFWEELDSFPDF